MPSPAVPENYTLCLGSDADFARVRDFLSSAGFDEATLCRTLRIARMSELGTVRWNEVGWEGMPRALAWSIRVFVRGETAEEEESRAAGGDEVYAAFAALHLLVPAKDNPSRVICPVWLYPTDGFLVTSDRCDDAGGAGQAPAADVVFPAIYAGTERFLRLLPDACGGDALDLCGGTGIGALHLSRTARSAATADLTGRSAFFAEFNARLNGRAIRSLCGDLYAPLAGLQFDLITAHPPFVPATSHHMIYRDAGDTGEDVTRGVVQGLPAHLRPGGRCVILCFARDTEEKRLEHRVADWLGADAADFEILYGLEKILTVEELVESVRKRGGMISDDEARSLYGRLRSLGTRQFVYGAIYIRRLRGEPGAAPARVDLNHAGGADDFARLLRWRHERLQPGFSAWLACARPRFAPGLELTVRHVMRDGELVPAEFVLRLSAGFEVALRLDGWVVPLLARLDGARSVEQVFATALAADELPAGFTLPAFSDFVAKVIEHDFMIVELPENSG